MKALENIRKKMGIDGETRNIEVLQQLGVPDYKYDHQKYVSYLEEREYDPISLKKMSGDLTGTSQFEAVRNAFLRNRFVVTSDSRGASMKNDALVEAVNVMDKEGISVYVDALSHASGEKIEHNVLMKLKPSSSHSKYSSSAAMAYDGEINLIRGENKAKFEF